MTFFMKKYVKFDTHHKRTQMIKAILSKAIKQTTGDTDIRSPDFKIPLSCFSVYVVFQLPNNCRFLSHMQCLPPYQSVFLLSMICTYKMKSRKILELLIKSSKTDLICIK